MNWPIVYCARQIPTFCFFVSTNYKTALYLRVQIWAVVGWNQSRRSEFSIIPSYDCLTERKSDVLGLSRQHVIFFAIIKQHLFNFWLSIITLLLNTHNRMGKWKTNQLGFFSNLGDPKFARFYQKNQWASRKMLWNL